MALPHHHDESDHHQALHHSDHAHHEHGAHAYDVNGHQPAIVNSDPNTLGHWHFDSSFDHVALAAVRNFSEELNAPAVPFANWGLSYPPQAARPPPAPARHS
jgi:hypothetical protein